MFDQEQRQDCSAQTVDCGLLHGRELVEQHGGRTGAGRAMGGQPAAPVAGAALQLQQRKNRRVLRGRERRGQDRGGHGKHLVGHQFQIGRAGPILAAVMDRGVKGGVCEVKGRQAGGQVDGHLRVPTGKAREARGEPIHANGGQDGEVQGTAGRTGAQGQRGLRKAGENGTHRGHIVAGGGGQVQATLHTSGPLHAKLVGHHLQLP